MIPVVIAGGVIQAIAKAIGGLIGGFLIGYLVLWIKKWKVPHWMMGIMPILVIPVLSTLIVGSVF